jgi:hypothetical protein
MAKRKSQLDRAIEEIDRQIATLQTAREFLVLQQRPSALSIKTLEAAGAKPSRAKRTEAAALLPPPTQSS